MPHLLRKKTIKGTSAAGMVALLQGGEGILFTLLGLVAVFASKDIRESTEFSVAVLSMKEILGVLISGLVFFRMVIPAIKKLRTAKGRWYAVSGILTGVGNLFYILGIAFAGPSYGVILTALYPIFSMILMKMFFKDKQGIMPWVGVVIAMSGAVLFTVLPATINDHESVNIKGIIGMLFGMLSAFLWAIEGVFIKKANDIKSKETFQTREMVLIRTTSSALTTLVILMPLSLLIHTNNVHHNAYDLFATLWEHWDAAIIVTIIAFNIVALRMIHLYAIRVIGPKMTAIIDTNNFLVGPFFSIFLSMAGGTLGALFTPLVWWVWLLIIPILVGVFMVIYFEKTPSTEETIRRERDI